MKVCLLSKGGGGWGQTLIHTFLEVILVIVYNMYRALLKIETLFLGLNLWGKGGGLKKTYFHFIFDMEDLPYTRYHCYTVSPLQRLKVSNTFMKIKISGQAIKQYNYFRDRFLFISFSR